MSGTSEPSPWSTTGDSAGLVNVFQEQNRLLSAMLQLMGTQLTSSGSGITAARPTVHSVGDVYFDTTLGLPVWWNGANWINAAGAIV